MLSVQLLALLEERRASKTATNQNGHSFSSWLNHSQFVKGNIFVHMFAYDHNHVAFFGLWPFWTSFGRKRDRTNFSKYNRVCGWKLRRLSMFIARLRVLVFLLSFCLHSYSFHAESYRQWIHWSNDIRQCCVFTTRRMLRIRIARYVKYWLTDCIYSPQNTHNIAQTGVVRNVVLHLPIKWHTFSEKIPILICRRKCIKIHCISYQRMRC